MARDGSGTYTRTHDDYQLGEIIDPADVNGELNDIATELTNSIDKGGRTALTGNLYMADHKLIVLANGASPQDSVNVRQAQSGALNYAVLGGSSTADAFVVTLTPAITGYTDGLRVVFEVIYGSGNTGACTINVNGQGARDLRWPNGSAMVAGDIPVYSVVDAVYHGTGFYLVSVPAGPLSKALLTNKGDLLGRTSTGPIRVPAGSNGAVLMARSSETAGLAYVAPFTSQIHGLTYQNNVSDSANDIDIAAGGCMDATNTEWIALSALTKQIDASWAAGTNQGGLDTGLVAGDSGYYIWAIKNPTTATADALFSLSATAPTMPSGYTLKRLIGWALTNSGGQWIAFKTYEGPGGSLQFLWSSPTLDVNLAGTLTTSRRTDAVKVPAGFATTALLNVTVSDTAGADVWVYCPDQANLAPGNSTTAPLATLRALATATDVAAQIEVRTSSTGTIAARASLATVDQYSVSTLGFRMDRRV